ncbi:MAG: ATP-binding cassette domain-containing protein [Microthrixaceae bacterium]|nr:ATP-binding cassette domain-containing protein [Microthrixaceae bacterium]
MLKLDGVAHRREGRAILEGIDWVVLRGQRWAILGPNGSGKTTIARIATLWEHPSEGSVEVLGHRLGSVDVRSLRRRLALVSAAVADLVRPQLSAHEVVMTARYAALEPWWHAYGAEDHARADALLRDQGFPQPTDRRFGSLSSGERQRVLLARSLMSTPDLVVLDEPAAGLDLGAREDLIDRLDAMASDSSAPPLVLVTHHVEEIPPSFTHVMLLRSGRVTAMGPLEETLTAQGLSECFGVGIELVEHRGDSGLRWSARRR